MEQTETYAIDNRGRGPREEVGVVMSDVMNKTIVVAVERASPHPSIQEGRTVAAQIRRPRREKRLPHRRPRSHHRVSSDVEDEAVAGCGSPGTRPGYVDAVGEELS